MKPRNTNIHGKIASVRQSHLLSIQLLKTLHILRTGRPGIRLNKTGILGIFLLGLVVYTSGGGVEEVAALVATGGLEHVHRDGGVVETQDGFVGDDEAHASHVSCEVVDLDAVLACPAGNLEFAQIVQDEFVAELVLLHKFILFPVDDGYFVAGLFEAFGDVGANEASATADADFVAVTDW